MEMPKPGIYKHFKGKEYELLFIARHSETLEQVAVYRALYGGGMGCLKGGIRPAVYPTE